MSKRGPTTSAAGPSHSRNKPSRSLRARVQIRCIYRAGASGESSKENDWTERFCTYSLKNFYFKKYVNT